MSTLGFGLGSALTTLAVSPVTSPRMAWAGPLVEGLDVAPVVAAFMSATEYATDTLGINPLLEVYRATYAAVVETVGVQQLEIVLRGIVLTEQLRLVEAGIANQIGSESLVEAVRWLDALLAGVPVSVSETVGTNAALVAQQATSVIEALGLVEVITPVARYGRTLVESLQVASALASFFGVTVSESLQLAEFNAVQLRADGSLSETVGVTDVTAKQLIIRVIAAEGLGISPVQAVRALYGVRLAEDIEISVGYLSPGDSFTTWAMNTRTGAVSEYDNYAFNSFARVGNKYIGANSSGLYELRGDTDAGAAIVSTLKGAYLQFGGTHLSRLKEAYIAATGDEAVFVLKIETLDGASYTYRVDTRSGRNTKVHMGKGQRARYFAYTLISAGQDFTLDTLEFVPITVQRRV